uniref:Anaphase-promoting complex subunit 4 WD40 domain-containing protein n=1 Tax=Amorphochlora amoebiformis TaxID=1561963 RepID=A0A7S0D9J5_9EUKA
MSPAVKTLKNRMVIDLERDPKAPMGVGGIGHDIEWSPTSERLAVSFKESNTDLIAVFGTSWGTLPSFQPLGYIRGPPSRFPKGKNMPIHMKFRPNCKGGALLAVCWAEGQISIYPLLFQSTTRVK